MTDDRLTSDELFAIFKGLIPTPVAFYLMNGGAKLDRGALEMVQAVREQATNDRIEGCIANAEHDDEHETLIDARDKINAQASHIQRLLAALSWAEKVDPDLVFSIRLHAAMGDAK
jgi:hypothetical protein